MKKLVFACLFSLGSVALLHAQDSTGTQSDRYQTPTQDQSSQDQTSQDRSSQTQSSQDQSSTPDSKSDYSEKDVISATELPAAIQEKLRGQDYSGWMVSKAYRKDKDGKMMYAVELRNGSDTKKVKFDADGNVLKEKDQK